MNATEWRTEQREAGKALKVLLIEADLMQLDVAASMGISQSNMAAYLNARVKWPADFEARFRAAVTLSRARS